MSYTDACTLTTNNITQSKKLIMQGTARVLGHEVIYRLYRLRISGSIMYQIYAGYQRDRVYCFVGNNRKVAERVFVSVIKGSVTPCTLPCIIEDLLPELSTKQTEATSPNYAVT